MKSSLTPLLQIISLGNSNPRTQTTLFIARPALLKQLQAAGLSQLE